MLTSTAWASTFAAVVALTIGLVSPVGANAEGPASDPCAVELAAAKVIEDRVVAAKAQGKGLPPGEYAKFVNAAGAGLGEAVIAVNNCRAQARVRPPTPTPTPTPAPVCAVVLATASATASSEANCGPHDRCREIQYMHDRFAKYIDADRRLMQQAFNRSGDPRLNAGQREQAHRLVLFYSDSLASAERWQAESAKPDLDRCRAGGDKGVVPHQYRGVIPPGTAGVDAFERHILELEAKADVLDHDASADTTVLDLVCTAVGSVPVVGSVLGLACGREVGSAKADKQRELDSIKDAIAAAKADQLLRRLLKKQRGQQKLRVRTSAAAGTVVALPRPVRAPAIPSFGLGAADQGKVKALFVLRRTVTAYLSVAAVSMRRATQALRARNGRNRARQLSAARRYLATAARLMASEPAARQRAALALSGSELGPIVLTDAQMLSAYDQVKAHGLPASYYREQRLAGLTPAQLRAQLARLRAFPPPPGVTAWAMLLGSGPADEAALGVAAALKTFGRAL